MKNKDEMLFANDIPTASTHGKMVAKLVCETANLKKRINDLLKENTEWKLENNRLNNIINELNEDIYHLLNVIGDNKDDIKVTSDEELAIFSCQNRLEELKENKYE